MGASHPNYCMLLGLSTRIEFSLKAYECGQKFVFNYRSLDCPITIKENADKILKKVLYPPEFQDVELVTGNKGTHSMWKFSTTFERRNGCGKDNVDIRARWKGKGRQQDTYVDSTLPVPDAKACATLCKQGPAHYKVRENSGISKEWICKYVVPHISAQYCESVAVVLGRALLWRIFDPDQCWKVQFSTSQTSGTY